MLMNFHDFSFSSRAFFSSLWKWHSLRRRWGGWKRGQCEKCQEVETLAREKKRNILRGRTNDDKSREKGRTTSWTLLLSSWCLLADICPCAEVRVVQPTGEREAIMVKKREKKISLGQKMVNKSLSAGQDDWGRGKKLFFLQILHAAADFVSRISLHTNCCRRCAPHTQSSHTWRKQKKT